MDHDAPSRAGTADALGHLLELIGRPVPAASSSEFKLQQLAEYYREVGLPETTRRCRVCGAKVGDETRVYCGERECAAAGKAERKKRYETKRGWRAEA